MKDKAGKSQHDPSIPRDELRKAWKEKPNVRLLHSVNKHEPMPQTERQNIISTMLAGMEQPFWHLIDARLAKLEKFYLNELTVQVPVGEGAAAIARAQEGYRIIQVIRRMPAQTVEELRRDTKPVKEEVA